MVRRPNVCIARRSSGLAIPACVRPLLVPTCSTGNGCAASAVAIAHDMFDAMGMHGFAERTRRELAAIGETACKRTTFATGLQLTPQEEQIARLAGEGLTNPDIGARLFISVKTVQYHLGKVFTKLDISSRSQLPQVLPR
jgi:DNA-binding CsgD family transcriptional regulator